MSEVDKLKDIIKQLLTYIELPDEPYRYVTAVQLSYEQQLRNQLESYKQKRELVYSARKIILEDKK